MSGENPDIGNVDKGVKKLFTIVLFSVIAIGHLWLLAIKMSYKWNAHILKT